MFLNRPALQDTLMPRGTADASQGAAFGAAWFEVGLGSLLLFLGFLPGLVLYALGSLGPTTSPVT